MESLIRSTRWQWLERLYASRICRWRASMGQLARCVSLSTIAKTSLPGTVAGLARELVARCRTLNLRANEFENEIGRLVRRMVPALLAVRGCGVLSAAKIVGEVAGAGRFRSKAAFARWNGTAPIPVWSANDTRQRLNRGGNRQGNAALHRIASTQWRGLGPGQAYVLHRAA